jgi:hypothetical protein
LTCPGKVFGRGRPPLRLGLWDDQTSRIPAHLAQATRDYQLWAASGMARNCNARTQPNVGLGSAKRDKTDKGQAALISIYEYMP